MQTYFLFCLLLLPDKSQSPQPVVAGGREKCSIKTGIDNVFLNISRILWCPLGKKEKSSCASVSYRGIISLHIFELIVVISIVNLVLA